MFALILELFVIQCRRFFILSKYHRTVMRIPDSRLCENQGADQHTAFGFTTRVLRFNFLVYMKKQQLKFLAFLSVVVHAGLCQTWSETRRSVLLASRLVNCDAAILQYLELNEFDRAVRAWTNATILNPKLASAWTNMASQLYAHGR